MPRVLFVVGTRPEAVKLAPVVHEALCHRDWEVRLCGTGQHRELLQPMLEALELPLDWDLQALHPGQSLNELLARMIEGLDRVIAEEDPQLVVAQGDTTTVLAAGLAAFHRQRPLAHVEAGLRSGVSDTPFPEEANRRLVTTLAALHLAPTIRAVAALRAEGVPEARIRLTGNTVVDSLRRVIRSLPDDGRPPTEDLDRWSGSKTLVLITGHRRESFRAGLGQVCGAVAILAREHPTVDWVYPLHANPSVQQEVQARLRGYPNIHLLPPLDYPSLLWLMRRARFIITDSGGIQEEAPEFGRPVLVTREVTERREAIEAGSSVLVGFDPRRLVRWAHRWLTDEHAYAMACPRENPFGDGLAAPRVVAALREHLALPAAVVPPWMPSVSMAA